MYVYRNQSSDEKTVLGHSVYGRYTKRDYVITEAGKTHTARRYLFISNHEFATYVHFFY